VSGHAEVQAAAEKPLSTSAAVAELRASKSDLGPRSSSPLRNVPSLQHPRRLPPRDLSSSIASNLASARGIRTNYTRQPLSPSISTHQAPGSLEFLPRKDGIKQRSKIPASIPEHGQPSWLPPTTSHKSEPQTSTSKTSVTAEATATTNDEGFSKFYSAFENILYKLSAPLAFASLPLSSEDGTRSPEPEPTPVKKGKGAKSPPENKTGLLGISQAALRASTRDGHSGTDSFYVVPTSGQTVSYAHILSFAEKEKRRLAASMHNENPDLFTDPNEDDDFVDARETLTPTSSRTSKSRRFGGKDVEIRVEELGIENKTLKGMVDELTKRLRGFELAAQSSSMALQESMRLYRDMSPARDPPALSRDNSAVGHKVDEALKTKILELEEQAKRSGKEVERLAKENDKLKLVVARYRDRWEQLKESAKTRREGAKENGKETQSNKDGDPSSA
jgi:hypothetical protein